MNGTSKNKNSNMKILLWLDDMRNPFLKPHTSLIKTLNPNNEYSIIWVRDYKEFTDYIDQEGLPDFISFDHDLKPEHYTPEYFWDDYEESKKYQEWKSQYYEYPTGEGCAKWLKQYCELYKQKLPKYNIHSHNPVGADKIKSQLL